MGAGVESGLQKKVVKSALRRLLHLGHDEMRIGTAPDPRSSVAAKAQSEDGAVKLGLAAE